MKKGARVDEMLRRRKKEWLEAMRVAAELGEFFAASDRLNLSAASRLLGKNRSSAQRAFDALQSHYASERDRLDD